MFEDRTDAGRSLAERLSGIVGEQAVVLALPRGGVPVAFEVARALGAPLDVMAVRKLGAVGQPELAVGAIAEEGIGVLDPSTTSALGMTDADVDRTLGRERAELERRVLAYREGRAPLDLRGRTAIVVDDGMATGLTVLAAVRAARARGAARVVVAVPVASPTAVRRLSAEADDVVCVAVPEDLRSVGGWYARFDAVPDAEVLALLARPSDDPKPRVATRTLAFQAAGAALTGDLAVPADPIGLVLFAHGSGSSRLSPRNQAVARVLNERGLATLLLDLLTRGESSNRAAVFDVDLLADRLGAVTRWATRAPDLAGLALAYFGASTGAAAALLAAADLGGSVRAVVSRGGRPDLARGALGRVDAPTLLIVGARDPEVLELNRRAARMLRCRHEIAIVPGAGHLFEEPGALETVGELAAAWFSDHLAMSPA